MKKHIRTCAVTGGAAALLLAAYQLGTSKRSEGTSHHPDRAGAAVGQKSAERADAVIPDTVPGPAQVSRKPDGRMTPELAARRLEELKTSGSISERASAAYEIIRELCENGHVDEAWALVEKDFGKVRTAGLDGFFSSLKVGMPVFETRFKELYNADESRSAMNSRMENFKTDEVISALMSPEGHGDFLTLKNLDFDCFSNSVYNRLHLNLPDLPLLEREGRLSDAFELQRKGLIRPIENVRMMYKLGDYDVFAKWEKLSTISEGIDFGSDTGYIVHTKEGVINKMLRESSLQAIDTILKSDGPGGSMNLQLAIGQWTELDSQGAAEWYKNHVAGLTVEKQSAAAAGFFGKAFDNGELDVARQWANQIGSPEMREVALAAIEKKEMSKQGR